MKRLLKALLPGSLYDLLSAFRMHRRSQKRDVYLKSMYPGCTLPSLHIQHLTVLSGRKELLAHLPSNAVVAEVGVAEGSFSRQILDVCAPQKLHLIDLWSARSERYEGAMDSVAAKIEPEMESGIVEMHRDYSWKALRTLPDDYLDWAYIDAAHDFESVQKDLEACRKKIKARGFIAGHDYTRWSSSGLDRWGVVEAVNSFCLQYDWEMLYLTNEPHRHLSFAIRRIQAR